MSHDEVGRKHKLSTIFLKKKERKKERIAGAYAQNHQDGSQSVTTTAPASVMVHGLSLGFEKIKHYHSLLDIN